MRNLELKRQRNKEWATANPQAKRDAAARYRAKRTPGRAGAYNRDWRRKNVVLALVSAARRRARREDVPFDPDILGELLRLGVPATCPVYGIAIEIGDKLSSASPSLDRVQPAAGYVPGNANRHKNNASAEQHEAIARYMRSVTLKDGVSAPETR